MTHFTQMNANADASRSAAARRRGRRPHRANAITWVIDALELLTSTRACDGARDAQPGVQAHRRGGAQPARGSRLRRDDPYARPGKHSSGRSRSRSGTASRAAAARLGPRTFTTTSTSDSRCSAQLRSTRTRTPVRRREPDRVPPPGRERGRLLAPSASPPAGGLMPVSFAFTWVNEADRLFASEPRA